MPTDDLDNRLFMIVSFANSTGAPQVAVKKKENNSHATIQQIRQFLPMQRGIEIQLEPLQTACCTRSSAKV